MHILIVLCALLLIGAPTRADQGKGVIVDYQDLPPATEAELFDKSTLVLRGRVEARHIDTPDVGPPMSVYTLRILELLKTDGRFSVEGLIDVHRAGGFDEETGQIGFAPFEVGDEVVLFLIRIRNGWYVPFHGPESAFKLTKDGKTHAYGRHGAVSKKYAGRTAGQLMGELRKQSR